MVAGTYRWAFLAASLVLLTIGGFQLSQARRACRSGGSLSVLVFGASAVIVGLVALFPQVIAALMADWLP